VSDAKHLPLRLTYDTGFNPLSFDFVTCLAICRAICHMDRHPDKLDVVLVNRTYRNVGIEGQYSNEYRQRKFREVLLATAMLCKWVNSVNIIRGETELPPYSGPTIPLPAALQYIGKAPQWQITPMVPKQLELLFKQGAKLPDIGFQAGESVLARFRSTLKNAVVIHPRVSIHNTSRNTSKPIMQEVTRRLRSEGFEVYFIPDVEDLRAGFSWSDFPAQPIIDAAFDMEVRLGAAEAALTNLIWSGGGNVAMLHFARANFLWTGFRDESDRVVSSAFFAEKGSTMGQNPPWLDPVTQIWDWTPKVDAQAEYVAGRLLELIGATHNRPQ
jgi:hypothetical protein